MRRSINNGTHVVSGDSLCPFSKPIIGGWCQCPHARLAERCSGKMDCTQVDQFLPRCRQLSEQLQERSRFVLGITPGVDELTHAQTMKARCGGLLGIHRLMQADTEQPNVPVLIERVESRYGDLNAFPYSDIVDEIQRFSHRAKPTA